MQIWEFLEASRSGDASVLHASRKWDNATIGNLYGEADAGPVMDRIKLHESGVYPAFIMITLVIKVLLTGKCCERRSPALAQCK